MVLKRISSLWLITNEAITNLQKLFCTTLPIRQQRVISSPCSLIENKSQESFMPSFFFAKNKEKATFSKILGFFSSKKKEKAEYIDIPSFYYND